MRYYIQFVDRTHRIVANEEGKQAFISWSQGRPIIIRGSGYAHHMVSMIKPMKNWLEDQVRSGKRFCKYGTEHGWEDVCECKKRGLELLQEDERAIVSLPEPLREKVALPEVPPTQEEQKKAEAYKEMRNRFIGSHSMQKWEETLSGGMNCENCSGKGYYQFQGTWIPCRSCSHVRA